MVEHVLSSAASLILKGYILELHPALGARQIMVLFARSGNKRRAIRTNCGQRGTGAVRDVGISTSKTRSADAWARTTWSKAIATISTEKRIWKM